MNKKRLINKEQLAKYLDISIHTVNAWVSDRKIPYVKMGRSVKFDLKRIDKFIKKNTVEPNEVWN